MIVSSENEKHIWNVRNMCEILLEEDWSGRRAESLILLLCSASNVQRYQYAMWMIIYKWDDYMVLIIKMFTMSVG